MAFGPIVVVTHYENTHISIHTKVIFLWVTEIVTKTVQTMRTRLHKRTTKHLATLDSEDKITMKGDCNESFHRLVLEKV